MKTLTLLAILSAAAAAANLCPAAELKVAVISMERAFDAYHKTVKAQADINARVKTVEAERAPLLEAAKKLQDELETMTLELKDKSMSPEMKEQKRAAAQEKYIELRQAEEKLDAFNRASQKGLNADIRETNRKLVAEIKNAVATYAAAKGCALVLDSSGLTLNDTEAVVWFDKTLDITDDIIAIINAEPEK